VEIVADGLAAPPPGVPRGVLTDTQLRHGRVSATAAIRAGRVPMVSTLYDASNSQLAYNISVTTSGGS